jgi:hypothetical protein
LRLSEGLETPIKRYSFHGGKSNCRFTHALAANRPHEFAESPNKTQQLAESAKLVF